MNACRRIAGVISVLAIMLLGSIGCADENAREVVAPQHPGAEETSPISLGHFRIVLDEDTFELAIEPDLERNAQYDVTQYAEISIPYSFWNSETRTWTLTVYLKNPTALQGYGVWGVFTEMGWKEFAPPDGFIYTAEPESKRVPVIAFGKSNTHRAFPPMYTDSRFVYIHWPEGVNNWIPIEFYVSAAWPGERRMPVVENLEIVDQPGYSDVFVIKAYIEDWQDPGDDLTVWADMTPINSGEPLMFDDGQHGDGAAGDKVFGGFFLDNAVTPADYTVTVHAEDPVGHVFENDVKYAFTGGVPEECFDIEVLAQGAVSQIHEFTEVVIENQAAFETYWLANFGSLGELPSVNFTSDRVIGINMGGKATTGYGLKIDRICIDPWSACLCMNVDYLQLHPGAGCITNPASTSPYWIGKIQKTVHEVHFYGMDYVYECPDSSGALNASLLADGYDGNFVNFGEYYIDNQPDFETFWAELTGTSAGMPSVDFATHSVLGISMGVQKRGMYFTDVRRVLLDTSGPTPIYKARYGYIIPPGECYSTFLPTVPYSVWRIPKPDYPLQFDRYDQYLTCY